MLPPRTDPVDVDEVLKRAHELTHGERNTTYGPPHLDYARVAAIYNAITGASMTSADAALFMIAMHAVLRLLERCTRPATVPVLLTALNSLEMRYRYAWAPGFSNRDVKTSREFCTIMMQMAQSGKRFLSGKVEPMQQQTSGGNFAPQDGDMPF